MKLRNFCISFLILCTTISLQAQDWTLEMETDEGIQVYTMLVEGEELKSVKITFIHDTKLEPIVSLIINPDLYADWVYKSISYKQIAGKGPGDGLFYGQVDFPWPLSDRDYIVETTLVQHPETKVVTIESFDSSLEEYPANKDYVRIPRHHNRWVLTPLDDNQVKGEYFLCSDPGGSLPDWAINMMIHEGSVKTIQNLFAQLENYQPEYDLGYIKEK